VSDRNEDLSSRRIHILREDVSRKIAAGEVIDRPFAVVRELLDNAIDSGARRIELYVEGGGLGAIRVVDDGEGMSREDLELSVQRHATSKIREEQDLHRVTTLGFRGEALASIAACSRLEIRSRPGAQGTAAGTATAHRLVAEAGRTLSLEPCQGNPGTVVAVADLFFNLPARRKFLRSPSAEAALCRKTFLEKALPHPELELRLFMEGRLSQFLPPQDLRARVTAALALPEEHFYSREARRGAFTVRLVVGRPELTRRDRRLLQIYVNRRRIYEYALQQAVEYAFSGYIPGGAYPMAFVFVEAEPGEVDFNVHPAKREARFQSLPALHHLLVESVSALLEQFNLGPAAPPSGAVPSPPPAESRAAQAGIWPASPQWERCAPAAAPEKASLVPAAPPGGVSSTPTVVEPSAPAAGPPEQPRYLGQLFRLFLLVQRGDSLYIVDQHAAHERLLFDEISSRRFAAQQLLLPLRLEAQPGLVEALRARAPLLQRLGIEVESSQDGGYEITALPEQLLSIEEQTLLQALLWERGSLEELERHVLSLAACRLAVKDGQQLDERTATELVRRIFDLPNARCPHGRPVWYEVSREELFRRVGRTGRAGHP
jgi:DNA mismatch repair protein MutL